jgi:aminopeptidase N
VAPVGYELALVPDAENLKFTGKLRVQVQVKQATDSIVLNAADLTLDRAELEGMAGVISLDPKLERATLQFARPVGVGSHVLAIDYHGAIGKGTAGFFAMDYDSPAGKRRTLATNFEPVSERHFMPSWDEPGLKATFQLTVDVPGDRMAVSNMPAASTEQLPGGMKRVHFARSPKMSTYLYFLGIGDFERITAKSDGTEVGVVVNRGDSVKGQYALEQAVKILHFYNGYFGVPFPLPKLDLIVAPGQITGGAMENWGAIFYGQTYLLFDPAKSPESDRQLVFLVVAHEMAHQWFGDLVTMAWWDDLWLNEGFARWMQTRAADELHPDWKTGLQALSIGEAGKRADSKPSTHPIVQEVVTGSQAEQAFDNITYDKGAAVIGMLEAYVGPEGFRAGVRRYMKAHAYGNTVDADFWREVQTAARKPVLEMEGDFTRQAGVPLLRVEGDGQKLALSEGRFADDPATIANVAAQKWHIPVTVSVGGKKTQTVVSGSGTTSVGVAGQGAVIVNAGQTAYARTLYPQAMVRALAKSIGGAGTADQVGILYDSWALGEAGYAPVSNYLELAEAIPAAADPLVWGQIAGVLGTISERYPEGASRVAFGQFATRVIRPVAEKLGWDGKPNEDPNASALRSRLLLLLSRFGDAAVVAEARRRYEAMEKDPGSFAPDVRETVRLIVARNADLPMLDAMIAKAKASKDPLEKEALFRSLTVVADPKGAERVLDLVTSPDTPAGAAPSILISVAQEHPDLAWRKAVELVDKPDFPLDTQMRLMMMPLIAGASGDRKRGEELQDYAEKHIPASARQNVVRALAQIDLVVKFRAERLPEIDQWLAGRK